MQRILQIQNRLEVALPRSKFGKKLTVIGKPRAPSAAASSAGPGKEASVAASTAASANLARSASGPVRASREHNF